MLSNTSTEWAPWFVIPADDKPFARVVAAGVIADALIGIDPQYPTVSDEDRASLQSVKTELMAQAPAGAKADPVEAELAAQADKKPKADKKARKPKKAKKGKKS